jgi:hypothetical protein
VAHRIAGFLGIVFRLELRTESTVSATGTVLFSDEKLGKYLPNWSVELNLSQSLCRHLYERRF